MTMCCCFLFPCKKCNEPKIQTDALWTEYLSVLQATDPTVGLGGINWYPSLYPSLMVHKDRIVLRFSNKYQLREISRENVSQWMLLLQNRFDEIADKYNHAYKLYDDENIDLDALGLGYTREYSHQGNSSGTGNSTSKSSSDAKFRDTPTTSDSTKNNPTTQTTEEGSGSTTSQSANSSSGSGQETLDRHDEHVMDEVNKLINNYKQLDEDFINEFSDMFIGLLAEWC